MIGGDEAASEANSEPEVPSLLFEERRLFHAEMLKSKVLHFKKTKKANVADGGSPTSVFLANFILNTLKAETLHEHVAPQTGGSRFEKSVELYLNGTLKALAAVGGRGLYATNGPEKITAFHQYAHLDPATHEELDTEELQYAFRLALGGDYVVTPDVVVQRSGMNVEQLNASGRIIDEKVGAASALRTAGTRPILHASVSCKQTIRSDRSQNSRLEALNLLRARRGRAPHIVVVTAEPLPTRLTSVALGTGDFDCTYHIALPELQDAMAALLKQPGSNRTIAARAHQATELEFMVDNGRLKDIGDLPLDLLL